MTVLVLTRPDDATADLVISELNDRRVPVWRIDPGEFPESLSVSARIGAELPNWCGTVQGQHQGTSLSHVRSVYYRRPSSFRLNSALSEGDARWAQSEARAGFGGLLTSLDCLWVNHPHRNAAAGVGPAALATASRCGLTVPETLITNVPAEARAFINGLPGGVAAYKAVGDAAPGDVDGWPQALWTNKVHAAEVTDSVALTAHQFQEWIPKAYEVRVSVVAGEMFAAEIHAGSDASRIDFRRDYDSLTYQVRNVPESTADGLRSLLAAFGLHYAALDFVVNDKGGWYLIDVNPNGQWAFVPELRTPITRALADLLEGRTHDHRSTIR
ncbi:ATP-grasp ribosomal peptide maturase [Streptomyces syringium]|uniref:ATP-grasp ribosomal peptide maturase n=1 Tax=Streptomyces syringium TaxID=76729 RepID=UPI0033F58F71